MSPCKGKSISRRHCFCPYRATFISVIFTQGDALDFEQVGLSTRNFCLYSWAFSSQLSFLSKDNQRDSSQDGGDADT